MSKNNRKKKKVRNKQKNSINKNTINKSQINQPNIQGDNNTTTTNINMDNRIEYKYEYNIYGCPEEKSLNNMREGLGRYEGCEIKNIEALFIPYLRSSYTIQNENVKGYGKHVNAYTILNLCSEDGELLSDHSQIEIDGITENGFKAWNIHPDQFTYRIRFSGRVYEYMRGDEKKIAIYATCEPEFIQDKSINQYKNNNPKKYSPQEIDDIVFDFIEVLNAEEYIDIIYRQIMYLNEYTRKISSRDFVLNYILSMLFIRSQNSKLARGNYHLVIENCDKEKLKDLKNIASCLCMISAYVETADYIDIFNMLRFVSLYIIKLFGIYSLYKNKEQDDRFKGYVNHIFGHTADSIINKTRESCFRLVCKNFKYDDDDFKEVLVDKVNIIEVFESELKQLSQNEKFQNRFLKYKYN